jgi:hypothetical protein
MGWGQLGNALKGTKNSFLQLINPKSVWVATKKEEVLDTSTQKQIKQR